MNSILSTTRLAFAIIMAIVISSSCQKTPQQPPNSLSSYIKKENTYHRLDSAVVFYDSVSPNKTMFSLGLHSLGADQNFVVFDYLIIPNTYQLLASSYPYQKVQSSQDFQENKFHDVELKCNTPVMSGVTHPISSGNLVITRSANIYDIKSDFVMAGKSYQIRFKGPVQHIKAW